MTRALAVVAALAVVLVVAGAPPAGAYARPNESLATDHPFAYRGPGIAVADPEWSNATVNYYEPQPPDCSSTVPASCDRILVHLDAPPRQRGREVDVDLTLTWPSDGSDLELFVYDNRPIYQNGDYGNEGYNWDGVSPAVVRLVDPDTSDLNVLVINQGTTPNTGYELTGRLTVASTSVPVDRSIEAPPTTDAVRAVHDSALGAPRVEGPAARPDAVAPEALGATDNGTRPHVFRSRPALMVAAPGGAAGHGRSPPAWWIVALAAAGLVLVVGAVVDVASRSRSPVGRWRYRDLGLVWKLLLPVAASTLVIGTVGGVVTIRYLRAEAHNNLLDALDRQSLAASNALGDRVRSLASAARFATEVEGLADATRRGDAPAAEHALASVLAIRQDVDLLVVALPDGRGLVELSRQGATFVDSSGSRWGSVPPVSTVISQRTDPAAPDHAGFVAVGGGDTLLALSAPVRTSATGALVGEVLVGFRAASVVPPPAAGTGTALYDRAGGVIGASVTQAPIAVPAPIAVGSSDAEATTSGTLGSHAAQWLFRPVSVLGDRVGSVAVALATGPAYAGVNGAAVRLVGIVVLVMAVLAALGVLIARSVLRDVRPLVDANRRLAEGDLGTRARVRSRDELGELADGFNAMAAQLEANRRQLEARVAERTAQLVRLAEARAAVLTAIGHDFRTPIFAIMRHGELMAGDDVDPADGEWVAAFGRTIVDCSRLLLDRVEEILQLARGDAVGLHLDRRTFDITGLIRAIEAPAAAIARSGRVRFDVRAPDPGTVVDGDERRLAQVLLNLVSNAVKYNRPDGRVVVSAVAAGSEVELRVADTGIGIPEDVGDLVFEPFYRVSGGDSVGSSGLGLAIVKQVVEAHGGSVHYVTAPGQGTTFVVRLPADTHRSGHTAGTAEGGADPLSMGDAGESVDASLVGTPTA